MRHVLILALLVQSLFGAGQAQQQSTSETAPCQPSELKEYEAEILLCLVPSVVAARGSGEKIGWELQTTKKLNQQDFYVFYVYNAGSPDYASPTIGYYGINKHTAEAWEMDSEQPVESKDLQAVEQILRKAHCIDEGTLKTYSSRRLDIVPK